MGNYEGKTRKYSLLNLIITVIDREITASEYIYYEKENIIREISHPAEIDENKETLIIKKYRLSGKDTEFSLDEFRSLFSFLPRWDRTSYYQLRDNRKDERYLSAVNVLIKKSKKNYECFPGENSEIS